MLAIDVGIGHDDDLVVAKFAEVELDFSLFRVFLTLLAAAISVLVELEVWLIFFDWLPAKR